MELSALLTSPNLLNTDSAAHHPHYQLRVYYQPYASLVGEIELAGSPQHIPNFLFTASDLYELAIADRVLLAEPVSDLFEFGLFARGSEDETCGCWQYNLYEWNV